MRVLLQSCLTLCDPVDYSLSGSSIHGFSRQEYWSGLPCPPSGDLPDPGIEPASLTSPSLADGFFTTSATWEEPDTALLVVKHIEICTSRETGVVLSPLRTLLLSQSCGYSPDISWIISYYSNSDIYYLAWQEGLGTHPRGIARICSGWLALEALPLGNYFWYHPLIFFTHDINQCSHWC